MIADLLGMEVSNASLYDGPTSVVEAVLMSARLGGHKGGVVYVNEGAHARLFDVLETYLSPLGFKVKIWSADPKLLRSTHATARESAAGEPVVATVLQSPNRWGLIEDWSELKQVAGELACRSVAYLPHALATAYFESPGEAGVDIAVGEGQSFGLPMGFGGPHLGLFACRSSDVRQMPGRLVGVTEDAKGQRAFCITLSTREQHIRRDKATSNICSNQNLMAVRAGLYLTLMGPDGLKRVAEACRIHAGLAAEAFRKRVQKRFPDLQLLEGDGLAEIAILVPPKRALWFDEVRARGEAAGVLVGERVAVPKSSGFVGALVSAFTERHTAQDIERWSQILAGEEGVGS